MPGIGCSTALLCQFSVGGQSMEGLGGGSICETGGVFRKKQVAEEDQYFRKYHEEKIDHHNEEIDGLPKETECHKNKIQKLKNDDD
uniref:ATPase inhibitor, mitochondrial n=1 Tax=Chrysemys picta bellii TaxID=8478 RepID=A0A8C3HLG4_CHRPI